jgi:hypothetical protein
MRTKQIPEEFIHFLWKFRMLAPELKTVSGEAISIIHPGNHNTDAGPDFLYARIRINNTLWAGNVEIHVKASDWYHHKHEQNEAYSNVILHVVAENDKLVTDWHGQALQTLCLDNAFDPDLFFRYKEITENLLWVPCMNLIKMAEPLHVLSRISALAIERLEVKSKKIYHELKICNMDWEECCYRILAQQFGAKINTAPFEMLSKSLPVKIIMKYHHELFQLEALLFGQSGLLGMRLFGPYPRSLKKEHRYLSDKHQLTPIPGYLWNFLRLRPAGFPTLRIAQLARLYEKHQRVFGELIEIEDIRTLIHFFELESSSYWDDHYLFDRKSRKKKKKFGKQSIQLLLINAILPLIHLYGEQMHKPDLAIRAIAFLEALPPEDNAVIRRWAESGVDARNALESQGLLQLKNTRCEQKLCLECSIGHHLLKQPFQEA